MAVLRRYVQLVVYLTVKNPVHAAAEGQRVCFVDVRLLICQVLVHVDECAALQADSVPVHEVDKSAVRTERTVGDYHHGVLALVVVLLYHFENLNRHSPVQVVFGVADGELYAGALSELVFRDTVYVHVHSSFRAGVLRNCFLSLPLHDNYTR